MDREAVERLTGAAVTGTRPVAGGYTNAVRCVATLADGRTVFVKAINEETRGWLRAEQAAYAAIDGSFMPTVVAAGDGTLVLEDLSGAHWPPPWSDTDLRAVRDALAELHALTPPPGLPAPEDNEDLRGGWRAIAEAPEPFLSLGVAEPAWLEANLTVLRDAGEHARVDGDSVVHMDIRSDNLCLAGGRCRIVDWNWVCRGNPDLDLAFWMPSLRLEGGPEPAGRSPRHPARPAGGRAAVGGARAGAQPPSSALTSPDRIASRAISAR